MITKKAGYFTTKEAAKKLGVPYITLMKWHERGKIKTEVLKDPMSRQRFYTKADIEKIRKEIKLRRA